MDDLEEAIRNLDSKIYPVVQWKKQDITELFSQLIEEYDQLALAAIRVITLFEQQNKR